jgi:cytochrome b
MTPARAITHSPAATARRLVWDLPLRLFHWLFAASVLASWATAQLGVSWMKWHLRLGNWMMGLVVFRILWGLAGPRHARFSSFLTGPRKIWRYARGLTTTGRVVNSVGHNPLGGLMVIFMLMLVVLQVGTGLFATDDITWSGPYNPSVSSATAKLLTRVHHLNFNVIWLAIGLHIAAILFYALVKKDNLIPAMLTGWKQAEAVPADQAIETSALWKAAVVIALAAGFVYWVVSSAPPPTDAEF